MKFCTLEKDLRVSDDDDDNNEVLFQEDGTPHFGDGGALGIPAAAEGDLNNDEF